MFWKKPEIPFSPYREYESYDPKTSLIYSTKGYDFLFQHLYVYVPYRAVVFHRSGRYKLVKIFEDGEFFVLDADIRLVKEILFDLAKRNTQEFKRLAKEFGFQVEYAE